MIFDGIIGDVMNMSVDPFAHHQHGLHPTQRHGLAFLGYRLVLACLGRQPVTAEAETMATVNLQKTL
jgi:hypothetical protein